MLAFGCLARAGVPAPAGPKPETYWQVDDVRPGMKGFGRTVMKGTKVETFQAEVLGVLKTTSPGRDLVLCRLSGLNLDKTGVIAGMSGSPVYIDGKLLGALAFRIGQFSKEPIAGITPIEEMLEINAMDRTQPDTMSVAHAPKPRRDAADDEIVRRVRQEPNPAAVRVVTSDRWLAEQAGHLGAAVHGADTFRSLLDTY